MKKRKQLKKIHITKWAEKTGIKDVENALGRFILPGSAGLHPKIIYVPGWKEKRDPKKLIGAGFPFEIAD